MPRITVYNEEMQNPFSPTSVEDDSKKKAEMVNDVKIFQFTDEVPPEYIEFLNNKELEIGPMQEKILDNGTYKVIIYYRKPSGE